MRSGESRERNCVIFKFTFFYLCFFLTKVESWPLSDHLLTINMTRTKALQGKRSALSLQQRRVIASLKHRLSAREISRRVRAPYSTVWMCMSRGPAPRQLCTEDLLNRMRRSIFRLHKVVRSRKISARAIASSIPGSSVRTVTRLLSTFKENLPTTVRRRKRTKNCESTPEQLLSQRSQGWVL